MNDKKDQKGNHCEKPNNLEELNAISQELKLDQRSRFRKTVSAVISIFKKIFQKLTFLKKKRFWIPLVIFHILMFAGTGYFAHYELTKKNKPGYILSTLQKSLSVKDPVLFNSIIDINDFTENFIRDFINTVQKYPYVSMHIGEIPSTKVIRDNVSFLLLDIFKGKDYISTLNNKTAFIPKNISRLLTEAPLDITANPKNGGFIISTTIYDNLWENIPIKLEVAKTEDGLKITKLANLNEILQAYNYKLTKRYQQEQNFQNMETRQELNKITKYLPNSTCSAQLGYYKNQHIVFIDYKADASTEQSNIISFAAKIRITDAEGADIINTEVKSNRLFIPGKTIQTSWRLPIGNEQAEILKNSKEIFCETTPVMVNAENGDYFDIRKKY